MTEDSGLGHSPTVRPIELLAVATAAMIGPLTWLGVAWPRRPAAMLVIGFAAFIATLGVLVATLLSRRFGERSFVGAIPLVVIIGNWGRIPTQFPQPGGWLEPIVAAAAALAVGAIMLRLRAITEFPMVVSAAIIAFAVGSVPSIVSAVMTPAEMMDQQPSINVAGPLDGRDVFLLVLDGHGRSDVLHRDFGYDLRPFLEELSRSGLIENPAATAPYSMTYASLAATFTGTYLVPDGLVLGPTHRRTLYELISGSNPVVSAYQSSGYEYVHIESGWGGTRCGPDVDRCITNPWSETLDVIVARSPFSDVIAGLAGPSFSRASLAGLDAFEEEVQRTTTQPRFVFGHILLPHPPLNVSAHCQIIPNTDMAGLLLASRAWSGDLLQQRRQAYLDQIQCVDARVTDIVEQIPDEAVVIVMSDHGPDGRGQLELAPFVWDRNHIDERLSALMVARFPPGCDVTQAFGANLFRVLLACQGRQDLEILNERTFIATVEGSSPYPVLEVQPPGSDDG